MGQIHIEASAVIDAPPEKVYAVLSDYNVGHRAILPEPYFTGLTVKKGGVGAGTELRVDMNVMGVKKVYHQVVTEPVPGRLLVETDTAAGVESSFTVEPLNNGKHCKVTITTRMKASPGIMGFLEKLMNPPITQRIYKQELQKLADYMRSGAPHQAPST